jgi:hypothetical protein
MKPIEKTLSNRAIGALLRPQKTRDKNGQKKAEFSVRKHGRETDENTFVALT